jgi:phosphotransferase system HPr-like phosphotransfer protein
LELMPLQAGQGMERRVSATGPDAELAVQAVLDLVRTGFGELHAS